MSFKNWKDRLAGKPVTPYLQPQPEDEGYYRRPFVEPVLGKDGKPNGQKRVVDWTPVGYFLADPSYESASELYCIVGIGDDARPIMGEKALDEEMWSYACRNPISYETWQAVAEAGEPWPDLPKPILGAAVKSREEYQAEIDRAILAAPKQITCKEHAEAAVGVKNILAELRLETDKIGKAQYEPLYLAYTKVQKPWASLVKTAKDAEDSIRRRVDTWTEAERQRVIAEKAEIERRLGEEAGRNARAADRAIARGEPEALEIAEIEIPSEDKTPLQPTVGKAYKQDLKTFVTITDEAAVAAYFHGNAKLLACLQQLADKAVELGQTVPGTTTREGII